MSGHTPAAIASLTPLERLSSAQTLNLAVALPLRNKEALTNLLHDLYDPASPKYHQYLTPEQFTEQFGPTEVDYQTLIAFARSSGLTVTDKHPNRALLDVRGAVEDIEKALHVTMRVYQHPKEARTFYAPDVEPSLDLAVSVLHISGLDNYTLPFPKYHKTALANVANAAPRAGSGPGGTYMGYDFRSAYVPGVALNGAGQVVGLLQFDGYYTNDIVAYENQAGLPNVLLENVLLDGFNGTPTGTGGEVEVSLDIEMVISMAPGVSKVIVYEAGPFGLPDDILNRMATENRARQLSCSWGWGGGPSAATDQIFQQMIAQGQTFFDASGDSDAFPPGVVDDPLTPNAPSDNPFITQVGGTTLTTTGPLGSWLSETVWNWGGGEGSSGGISSYYDIPVWQQGVSMAANGGSVTMRNLPDVALTADNVYVIADNGQQDDVGGTSCAAPLWAGFTALVNQQAAAVSLPPVGFLNPAIYAIGKGANYANCFHDIITGNNTWSGSPNLFFAVPGYDLCTGWGTPAGTNLINAIITPVTLPSLIVVSNFVFGGNGNGIIDYDECNSLNLILANIGNAGATGIHATLSTTTPEVAIAQATSAYPDIPVGASATNLVPFKVSTSPSFICGTPINFLLLLVCDQTETVYRFSLPTGLPGVPLRFDNSSMVPIPPLGTTNSSIVVSNIPSAVNKVTVSMFVEEYYDYFLALELIAPDGTTNILSANNGLLGANYGIACSPDSQRTTFDDAATTPIALGTAPFAGSFQPTQPLAVFAGKSGTNVNGLWQLRATDEGGFGSSAIVCWSLFITPTLCTEGGGECPGADLALGMTAQPNPVIAGNNLTYTIMVTNNGPSTATNVSVTHLVPAGVLFVSASSSQGTYGQGAGAVTFNLGRMGPRATATMTVVALPTVAGTIFSTATVSSEQPDFNPANNSATVETRVSPATADLGVTLAAAPSPTLVGSLLTYSIGVTNYGPSAATGITVTNALPATATIQSVTGALGSFTTAGHVVFWNLPGLAVGAGAAATITVIPTVQGTITATTTVAGNQFDPIAANNTAIATTAVGPAADLALGLTENPNPVVTGSNVLYIVAVTNFGPSPATSVIVNDTLPASVAVVSSTPTQGTTSISNNTLIWNVGSLATGAKATMTITASTTTNGTLSSTATAIGAQADANLANNSATVTTVVTAPFVSIVAAGATLTYESGPVNGAIDLGETVTVVLRLRNAGNSSTRNLVATLLAINGVAPVAPNNPQTFGIVFPSGFSSGRPFSFTASGVNGGTVTPTLQLQDGTNTYPPVSFSFTLPNTFVFANSNAITIPDPASPNPPYPFQAGPATPYPSANTVSNLTGVLGKVTVTLSNLNHTYPGDVNVLLVAPAGAKTLVMSHAGSQSATGLTLTLDDSAPDPLPDTGGLVSGTWQPAAYGPAIGLGGFPTNAPAGPYPTALSTFNSVNPNGAWSLYVFDDSGGDAGSIANGWSLALTMITPVNQLADLALSGTVAPGTNLAGGLLTYTFTITNNGPNSASSVGFTNVLPAGVTLVSASLSQGNIATNANSVIGSLGALATGTNATVTVLVIPTAAAIPLGTNTVALVNTASVGANEVDVNPANNSVSVVSTVNRPVADLALVQTVAPDPVYVGYYLTNALAITNKGPGAALSVLLTQPLPPGAGFIPGNSSAAGTFAVANNTITCMLGDLPSNSTAVVIIVLTNSTAGLMTNAVSLSTGSSDPVPANNSSTYVATVLTQAPKIINAGAVMTSESGPVNGAIDPNETVALSLSLANIGAQNTVNLKATLLATNGVALPGSPQYYGALVYGGPSTARSFSFKAASALGSVVVATLQLQDERPGVTNSLGTVAFVFGSPATNSFSNSALITIPDHGIATPYPSTINVSGMTGRVSKVTLGLNGLTHAFPHDVNVVLVSPAGTNVLVMSHTGGGYPVTNIALGFDDAAAASLPNYSLITNGTNKPSSYQGPVALPGTAQSKSYQYVLSGMTWNNPNGAWSLYVFDDSVGDAGSIVNGWSLNLSTVVTVGPVVDLAVGLTVPTSVNVGGTLTNTIIITNSGPDTATGVLVSNQLPVGASFVSASLSQGSFLSAAGGWVTCNLGSIPAGASAKVTVLTTPTVSGSLVNWVSVASNEEDLVPANNTAQATTTTFGPASLSGSFSGGHFVLTVTAQPNYVYVVQGATNLTYPAHWVSLSTNNNTTGTFNYIDTTTPAPQQRFYRTMRQ